MARVNIYIPDELADAARGAGLKVSLITQEAIRAKLAAQSTDDWLRTLRNEPAPPVTHELALDALDSVRDEATTRHG